MSEKRIFEEWKSDTIIVYKSPIAFANLAYQQTKRGAYSIDDLRKFFHHGASLIESEGPNQNNKEEACLMEVMATLDDASLISMIIAIAQVRRKDGWLGILKEFTKDSKKQRNGTALEQLIIKLKKLSSLDDNPWLWAAYFAAKDLKTMEDNNPFFEKAIDFATTHLLRSAESPVPMVIFHQNNPYRPGLDFRTEDVLIFQGQQNIIQDLLADKKCLGLKAWKGFGKTWILQVIAAICGDPGKNENVAQLHRKFEINNIKPKLKRLPLHSIFIRGKKLACEIIDLTPFDIFASKLRMAINNICDSKLNAINISALAEEINSKKLELENILILIDDFDFLLGAYENGEHARSICNFLENWPGKIILSYKENLLWPIIPSNPSCYLITQIGFIDKSGEIIQKWAPDLCDEFPLDKVTLSQIHAAKWGQQEWKLAKNE